VSPALRNACKEAIHVVTVDGEVLRGATSLIFVYERLGYYGVGMGRRRPFIWALDATYSVVVNNRMLFSKFLFRQE